MIHALTVMLPVSRRVGGLPRATYWLLPFSRTAELYFPGPQVAPPVSVPVRPRPEASAATVPVLSSKAYPARTAPGWGGVFDTLAGTGADVVVLPAASRALAVRSCVPFVAAVVSHVTEYGELTSSAPSVCPSRRNWTAVTPMASDAVAVTLTLPLTVAPADGAEIETVGGVVSGGGDWVVASALADWADSLPAASKALTRYV